MDIYDKLLTVADKDEIRIDEPMKRHTTFKVGGPADYFVEPGSEEKLIRLLELLQKEQIPFYIMGNGSNLLVGDKGFRGVIIQTHENLSRITVDGSLLTATAGASLTKIANTAAAHSLTGFEFASGIPGTIGGACVMNAGAYDGEMKDVLKRVKALTPEGIAYFEGEEMELGYRTSVFSKQGYIVLEAEIELQPGDEKAIKDKMADFTQRRISKQPLEYPSAGSTFKRPAGYFAGKLIQEAGLRGHQLGGAMVSDKHSGFVINYDNATARDIISLMNYVIEKVRESSGVTLEPEVKRIGEF